MKLPYSQFWAATAASLQSYPMYGSYTKENGNKLVFDDAFAVLDLALTGSAKIASVKVENLAESPLAGYANFLPSRGYLSITGGVGFRRAELHRQRQMRLAGERHAETFLRDAGSGRLSVGPENHHFRFGAPLPWSTRERLRS